MKPCTHGFTNPKLCSECYWSRLSSFSPVLAATQPATDRLRDLERLERMRAAETDRTQVMLLELQAQLNRIEKAVRK